MLPAALIAQQAVISGNGKFIGVYSYTGKSKETGMHHYEIKVYSTAYKSLVQRLEAELPGKAEIDSISLSFNGKMLYLVQGNRHMLFNVRTGKKVAQFDFPVKLAFAHEDNFFIVSNSLWVKSFDSYTGNEQMEYHAAADNKINRITVSPDDALIIAMTDRDQVIFWKVGTSKPRKKFFGEDMVLSSDGTFFTILRLAGPSLSTYTYSLPDFKRIRKQNMDKILRDRARENTLEIRAHDPSRKSVIIRPSKFIDKGYQLSDVGNYLSFFAASPLEEKQLFVIHTLTGQILLDEVVGSMKQNVSVRWYNDSLMIPVNAMKAGVFNARKGTYENDLDLEFAGSTSRIREKKQTAGRRLSPNFAFTALENEKDLLVRDNNKEDRQIRLEDHAFLGYSPNSAHVFLQRSEGDRVGYFNTAELRENGDPMVHYFSEEKRDYVEEAAKEEIKPAAYSYTRLKTFRHISEARPDDSVKIFLKTVESGKHSGVQVHLIDRHGNYYYGAGSEEWKKIWCNLMVKGSDGAVRQVSDFVITEHRNADSLEKAMTVIMDFSGSMGWPRADALQDGVEKLIKAKRPKDEIALVKYDSKVLLESRLEKDVSKLLKRLHFTGYSYFGGATALLDAINAGIFAVKNAEVAGNRIVLAMTDGFENASMATRNEVLAHAVQSGVNIYTIGFGQLVDEQYLKSLSYTTYGGHYQVYETPDLDWIFTDIYKKASNYYTINYETDDRGSQVYLLKICLDGIVEDSLAVIYDNDPADVNLLLSNDDLYKPNPVKSENVPQAALKGFDHPEIKNFSRIRTRTPKGSTPLKIDEDKITAIEDEFMTVELPKFNFYYDEVRTVQETEKRITDLADFMRKYPEIRLEISGHTDNSGTTEYNDRLSMDRAVKVRDMIVKAGIPAERFEVRGYGEISPVAENDTETGRARNRRVEFRILSEN